MVAAPPELCDERAEDEMRCTTSLPACDARLPLQMACQMRQVAQGVEVETLDKPMMGLLRPKDLETEAVEVLWEYPSVSS
mmetsp:Transcript_62123/g.148166  ORF Transcript_62123/g.148166 Transcript_62123/m.148166 type:complete len:80 (+) Transcript_62123:1433-1672(+)